jgi:hypothetical protein
MTEPSYSFRANLFTPERTYRIGPDALRWTSGAEEGRIGFGDVCEVRLRRQSLPGEMAIRQRTMSHVEMRCSSGRRLTLSPLHYAGFRTWEDRSTSYVAFVSTLLTRLRDRNAELKVVTESHWTLRLRSIIARGLQAVLGRFGESALKLIRKLGLDRAARLGSVLMRSVGPWLGAHRVARVNLKAAFPDKSDAEIDRLLQGVWDNFGRVMAEYAFLDQLYDYDPLKPHKWIVIDPADIDRPRRRLCRNLPSARFRSSRKSDGQAPGRLHQAAAGTIWHGGAHPQRTRQRHMRRHDGRPVFCGWSRCAFLWTAVQGQSIAGAAGAQIRVSNSRLVGRPPARRPFAAGDHRTSEVAARRPGEGRRGRHHAADNLGGGGLGARTPGTVAMAPPPMALGAGSGRKPREAP